MRPHRVHYPLMHGFIQNWLVAGPQSIPLDNIQNNNKFSRHELARQYYDLDSGIRVTPIERGPLTKGIFKVGDYSGSWEYYACRDDHQVDHSVDFSTPHYQRSWAFTQLASKTSMEVQMALTTFGPADLWLNGQHIHRQEHFNEQHPSSMSFKAPLAEGINKVLVRFEGIGVRKDPHAMALQIGKASGATDTSLLEPYPPEAGLHVCIPTLIQSLPRRNTFEKVYTAAYVKQDIFTSEEPIYLYWPDELEQPSPAVIRLMLETGKTYAEATVDGTAGDKVFLGYPSQIPEGPYRIFIMPLAWEYYEHDLRITRQVKIWCLGKDKFSTGATSALKQRRQEALSSAARQTGLFAEIAKMAMHDWQNVKLEIVLQAAQSAAVQDLLGLLGMVIRYGDQAEFPKEITGPVEDCILGFPYRQAGTPEISQDLAQSQVILLLASEILAGQLYPERVFSSSGEKGQWHRENGERSALEWLGQRGAAGFADWGSGTSCAEILTALSHLVDLAEAEPVWDMASILMDKVFFTLATNSFQGVLGSAHDRSRALYTKGGLLDPASGINRLMWGTGIFNHQIAGPVSLACMEKYEIPAIITNIALTALEEMWSQERHAAGAGRFAHKVTYKTPDSMLSSVQDYYPGETGCQEHIWQATLGPAATVFVTHPACSGEADARQPNYWAGNAVLPRVAQWKDILIAVYHLPEGDWMGFTHAYFPAAAFDEYIIREGWAFARKGNGYLALTSAQGFEQITTGSYAFRELRSYGQQNAWICQMGRAAVDGDFNAFQEKILALELKFEGQAVHFSSLRGDDITFGWQGPFVKNGHTQPLSWSMHYQNPFTQTNFPCTQMEIQFGEDLMRLDFGSQVS